MADVQGVDRFDTSGSAEQPLRTEPANQGPVGDVGRAANGQRAGRASEKRTKKGKRKAAAGGQPPPLGPDDYVRIIPVPKRTEVLHEGWRPVSLSVLDKALQIEVDDTQTRATSRKGYRMVRATHGACEGTWFYEAKIEHLGTSGHVRLGWSTRKGELQAPVGYDEYSFAYRDLEGVKVHEGLREPYGESFEQGDVVGCYIHLGQGGRPFEKERSDIVAWKGSLYFQEDPAPDEPRALKDSVVAFTKNGKLQGIAYRDILEGTYYPAISIYTLPSQSEGATVSVKFGPEFSHAMPEVGSSPQPRPVSAMAGDPPPAEQPKAQGSSGSALQGPQVI